jgi:hypothetical protein
MDTRSVAHFLELDEPATVFETGSYRRVMQGGERELALADPARPKERDRLPSFVENPTAQLFKVGVPAQEPSV